MKRVFAAAAVSLHAALLPGAARAQGGPPAGSAPAEGLARQREEANAPQARTKIVMRPTLSSLGAATAMNAVADYATAHNRGITVVIVDAGGNLLAMRRTDGASLGTIDAAMRKAVSALKLQAPTGAFGAMASSNPGLALGFISAGFTILGGGQPIVVDGKVVGAIASSGGAAGEDDVFNKIGQDAIAAMK